MVNVFLLFHQNETMNHKWGWRGKSIQSKWNMLLRQNEDPNKMKYFILESLWCFYFPVKIEWKCHFSTQNFIWQLYRAICKIFTFPSWHFEKNWLRVCFSWTSRSDHVQSCFALFPQLWLKFSLQCPQELEKSSLCIISIFLFPSLAADGFGWSLAEGRVSACCDPSF